MVELGFTLSSEEHGPNELVDYAVHAEEVGFDFLSISDHFHPWVSAQGESPFVWSVLGALARRTDEIEFGVGVTCPIVRIHPVNVAHAVATTQVMADDRFTFAVGTGENLNEHVTGEKWPEHDVRLEMLAEAMALMRALWAGENTSHHGEYFTAENARLYTVPEEIPEIVVSAFGPETAQFAGEDGDGLWTSGPRAEVVDAYEGAGGEGPKYAQLHCCYAATEDEAVDTVYEYWPNGSIPGELGQELPTPAHFQQAATMVEREDVAEGSTVTDPDPQAHIDSIEQAIEAGYDHVYVHQIGPEQDDAIEFYAEEVLPSFS
ncbi:TIGR03557 family F420-dependent LLM class oxidoreductase [Halostagnicola kamekurae]|uniref:F420-dependent oxidoreductase, G6PDH family n=1 Tax=Halostagnicola kamekurae TaxID=619731 RepID=A0A1I6S6N1_9EURY|nr:TIGR03557 family F420-dependent LLM class oxidoreductase [Halostagnicola kamekurae]SFS72649.1 F420-dependent oxidoreductase, G6PDH family [Halostagnicola kamekurae]